MLQDQVVPINFGGGVDTKTDSKAVIPGKFLRLENGVFTNANRITKRNGYTSYSSLAGGGSFAAPKMLHAFQGELLCADSGNLYSYAPFSTNWSSRGSYNSVALTRSTVSQQVPASGNVDCVYYAGYAIYAWSTAMQSSATYPAVYSVTYTSVVDTNTGAVIGSPLGQSTASANFINQPKLVLLGGTQPAVLYVKANQTALVMRLITISSGSVSYGSELTVTTNYAASGHDIVQTTTGAALIYKNTTGLTVATIDTAGAVTGTASTVDAIAGIVYHINVGTDGKIWCYWVDDAGAAGCKLVYAVYSSVLAAVVAKTTVEAIAAPRYVTNISSVVTSTTVQTVYYGVYTAFGSNYVDQTRTNTANTSGVVGTAAIWAQGVLPLSRTIAVGSSTYGVFLFRGCNLTVSGATIAVQLQPTYFLVQISSAPLVVGRFGAGVASSQLTLSREVAYVPNLAAGAVSTSLYFACGIETQEFLSDAWSSLEFTAGGFVGAFSYVFDFASADAWTAVNAGGMALLSGAVLQAYDGQNVNEFGFHINPELYRVVAATTAAGAVTAGAHSVIVIFQWTDANGNLHQSAPSNAQSVTVVGPDNTINISVSANYLSQKSGVAVAAYMTVASGSTYYLATDPIFLSSADTSVAGAVVTINLLLSDAQLAGSPQPYTDPGSSVLENSVPAPSTYLLAHNNRAWFVDAENPDTIWYTKTVTPGVGLSPSGFMTQTIDHKLGNPTGLAEMDDKLVIFKQQGFAIQAGDGVTDTGAGNTLTTPQFVPSDVGCTGHKSIILMPNGLMFQSASGVYLLDRSLQVSYIGAEVESYNSQTITAATRVPGKTQIRFLCSSGLTLVYDYLFKQWSTFTNHTGVSAAAFQSLYWYVATDNTVLREATGTYTDNGTAFAMLARTSWLAFGGIQGFQRVKRLIMLGDYANGNSASHALSISAAYDFSTTFQTAVSYAFGAASSSGVFQYREMLPIQKCDALSLIITETTTGSGSEYIDLTNISFEVGVKRGVNKLAGSASV